MPRRLDLLGLSPTPGSELDRLLKTYDKSRRALVVSEDGVEYIMKHRREIGALLPCGCNGVLVRLSSGGTAYHLTGVEKVQDIQDRGIQPSWRESGTFGTGVVYAYESLSQFEAIDAHHHAVFKICYGPGCLRSLWVIDKEDDAQHELLLFPSLIESCTLLTLG